MSFDPRPYRVKAALSLPNQLCLPMENLSNYGSQEDAKVSLWLRQIGTNSESQILPLTDGTFGGVAFSPDALSNDSFTLDFSLPFLGRSVGNVGNMTPEHWQQVNELFMAAVELEPARRRLSGSKLP